MYHKSYRMPEPLFDELQRVAGEMDVAMSEVLRIALREYFERTAKRRSRRRARVARGRR